MIRPPPLPTLPPQRSHGPSAHGCQLSILTWGNGTPPPQTAAFPAAPDSRPSATVILSLGHSFLQKQLGASSILASLRPGTTCLMKLIESNNVKLRVHNDGWTRRHRQQQVDSAATSCTAAQPFRPLCTPCLRVGALLPRVFARKEKIEQNAFRIEEYTGTRPCALCLDSERTWIQTNEDTAG